MSHRRNVLTKQRPLSESDGILHPQAPIPPHGPATISAVVPRSPGPGWLDCNNNVFFRDSMDPSLSISPCQSSAFMSASCLTPSTANGSGDSDISCSNESMDSLVPTAHRPTLAKKLVKRRPPSTAFSSPPSSYSPSGSRQNTRPVSWYSIPPELFPRPLSPTDIALAKQSSLFTGYSSVPFVSSPEADRPVSLSYRNSFALSSQQPPPAYEPTSPSPPPRKHRLSLRELAELEQETAPCIHLRPRSLNNLTPEMGWKRRSNLSFLSSLSPGEHRRNRTMSARSSTEVLSSLAWNGLVPVPSSKSSTPESSEQQSKPSLKANPHPNPRLKPILKSKSFSQPPLSRHPTSASASSSSTAVSSSSPSPIPTSRHKSQSQSNGTHPQTPDMGLKRGWSFAMAMSDECVTDEVLVAELERLRKTKTPGAGEDEEFVWMVPGHRRGRSGGSTGAGVGISLCSGLSDADTESPLHSVDSSHTLVEPDAGKDSLDGERVVGEEDEAMWHTARRALLCCREIVRTERRYQEELKALIAGETTTPPPPLMQHYLPDLLNVSQTLLKSLAEDPSAWGVATAFVACEEELDVGMVAWAGVVGQFFTSGTTSPVEKSEKSMEKGEGAEGVKLSRSRIWRKRSMSRLSRAFSAPTSPSPPVDGKLRKRRAVVSVLPVGDEEQQKENSKGGIGKQRKFTVRDLAIQPTQRVMRYVMLYRDLLAHTPATSPSHALVSSALEVAQRIALKCDRAQNNAAFIPRTKSPSMSVPLPPTSPSLQAPEPKVTSIPRSKTVMKRFISRPSLRSEHSHLHSADGC